MRQWTQDLAWAASKDAGNQSMRAAGRKAWSVEDYNVAVETFTRLYPLSTPPQQGAEAPEGTEAHGGHVYGDGSNRKSEWRQPR